MICNLTNFQHKAKKTKPLLTYSRNLDWNLEIKETLFVCWYIFIVGRSFFCTFFSPLTCQVEYCPELSVLCRSITAFAVQFLKCYQYITGTFYKVNLDHKNPHITSGFSSSFRSEFTFHWTSVDLNQHRQLSGKNKTLIQNISFASNHQKTKLNI